MFPVLFQGTNQHRPSRRELLRIGGISALGLTMSDLARMRAASEASSMFGRRQNSCVFLFLFGGPSHIDLWDMKPQAPHEVRGEFKPASTTVPGIHVCEHLPHLARHMNKVCLLRSLTHRMNVHGPACSEIFSGREYFGPPITDEANREDWPSLSSLVMRFGRHQAGGLPASVVLPWYLHFPGQSRRIAGQTAGRMGERHNALLVHGDLARNDFELQGLRLAADVPQDRIRRRRSLLDRMDTPPASPIQDEFAGHRRNVYRLLDEHAGEVFDLQREPEHVRARYGRTAFGQSLLLARRLVEAGVALITVNWEDETKIDGVNTCWDTHQDNFPKLKNLLCPLFDQAYTAFIDDLHARGLLGSTLVVAAGEFGRTPKLGQFTQSNNTKKTGRDHWPHAFTALLAGGGVRGGQVYGETTPNAGFVKDKPVTPADLTATILLHLGVDPAQVYQDEFQKLRYKLSEGTPVRDLG